MRKSNTKLMKRKINCQLANLISARKEVLGKNADNNKLLDCKKAK